MHRIGIGKIERDENAPNIITLVRIAMALDIRAMDILGQTKGNRPKPTIETTTHTETG
ncbi:MAG: hypothetical protein P8L46_10075 [Acidimicrobiales bacterium]|jgi:hypothetical protein|nr:hypothetical protein [Acidimicrobiales bacterium]MDG2218377.1 hypothetical protein [Acidimicrobiales bacterium]